MSLIKKAVLVTALMALLLAGIAGIAGAAKIEVYRYDNALVFNATEGTVTVPVSGENMTMEGISLPDEVYLWSDGKTIAVVDTNRNGFVTPFEEGPIYISGANMTVLSRYYVPNSPGWTFLLNGDPLAIIAVGGEVNCECADCGCAEAAS